MTLDVTDRRAVVASRSSRECPACRRPKKAGFAFCRGCRDSLPRELAVDLYLAIGRGYEEGVRKAYEHLTRVGADGSAAP